MAGKKGTNQTARLVALLLTFAAFLALCGVIATRPFVRKPKPRAGPRLVALAARERHLRHEAVVVRQLVRRRWIVYRRRLNARRVEIATARRRHVEALAAAAAAARAAAASTATYAAAAPTAAGSSSAGSGTRVVTLPPQVRVVSLPPVTVTRTS